MSYVADLSQEQWDAMESMIMEYTKGQRQCCEYKDVELYKQIDEAYLKFVEQIGSAECEVFYFLLIHRWNSVKVGSL